MLMNGSGRSVLSTQGSQERLSKCNLHSITARQAAIIALFRVVNRCVGHLPPIRRVS
jgi:hypothetical protein